MGPERRAEIEAYQQNTAKILETRDPYEWRYIPQDLAESNAIIHELLDEIDRLTEGARDAAKQVLFQSGPVWDEYVSLGGTER